MTKEDSFFSQTSMVMFRFSILCTVVALLFAGSTIENARADLVTITDDSPSGTTDVSSSADYVGLVDALNPTLEVDGNSVTLNGLPTGESVQIGDLIGRDMNANSGSRQWEYLLELPADAFPGTGFQNIIFDARAYERTADNLEGADELTWEMFLNGSTVAVDSATSGAGVDFNAIDVSLSNPGGDTITEVRVVFSVIGFNGGGEAFGTRGVLSASYNAVPEPGAFAVLCGLFALPLARRRKS